MRNKLLLFFSIVALLFVYNNVAYARPYFGNFEDPDTYATSTDMNSLLYQSMGYATDFSISEMNALGLILETDGSGDTVWKVQIRCNSTQSDNDLGRATCGATDVAHATTTASQGAHYTTANFWTPYTFDSSKYYNYRLSIQSAGGATEYLVYGTASTTDLYTDGLCLNNQNSPVCYTPLSNTFSPTGMSDQYFIAFGTELGTTLVQPIPDWWAIVPVASSTDPTQFGGTINLAESDNDGTIKASFRVQKRYGSSYSDGYFESDYLTSGTNVLFDYEVFDEIGVYNMYVRVYETDLFGLGVGDTLYATTTQFIVGYDDSDEDPYINDPIDDIIDVVENFECTIDWGEFSSIFGCIGSFIYEVGKSVITNMYEFLQDFLNRLYKTPPWGYIYRAYYIMDNPNASSTLPSLDVHFTYGDIDTTVDFSPWDSIDTAVGYLDATTSTSTAYFYLESEGIDTENSIGDKLYNIINIIFGILFAIYVAFRLFGLSL